MRTPIGAKGFFRYQGRAASCVITGYRGSLELIIEWSGEGIYRCGKPSGHADNCRLCGSGTRTDYLWESHFEWERPQERLV